tara:strand:+ start:929 stop:1231 length:303 start_codon:yes stop_codon:yes gene_type:complete
MATAKFELKAWLTENKETVIASYTKLTAEKFFNGITLKDFMVAVMQGMANNSPKSANKASSVLLFVMGDIYFNNSNVDSFDAVTARLKSQAPNQQWSALI